VEVSDQISRLTACVFAQQYSSVTFVSSCLYSRKEKFGAHFKNVITSSSLLFKNSRESEIA
jgi:hypothetical protein